MILNECKYCGANLDPNEICDCVIERERIVSFWDVSTTVDKTTGQIMLIISED